MATKSASVALNIGSQRVSMATFAGGGSGALVIKNFDARELAGDPTAEVTHVPLVKEAVGQLAQSMKTKGLTARYAVGSQSVFTRFVKLPPLSQDKVGQIVEFEAQQNVPFPLDEVAWGYQLIGEPGSGEVEVLLGAIKSDELNAVNAAVESSGLSAVSADISPMLVYNAFRYNYPEVFDPVLVIDIGSRTTDLIYVEGQKVFIGNSRIGGSSITSAVAKDLEISFEEAERIKIEKGQVVPGNYAPPEDEVAAVVANQARNQLTRLHQEIVRANNRYKSQQGGNPPKRIYLAGGAAAMPGVAEFFAEKFGVPVEYFNAMRNVAVGPKVNAEAVAAQAHCLGELVGLALRNKEGCPIELELVPESVSRSRDLEKRKPALIFALVSLLGTLAAISFYFFQATNQTDKKTAQLSAEAAELDAVAKRIQRLDERLKMAQSQAAPFKATMDDRVRWLRLLNDLNAALPSDMVWLTLLEPTVDGKGFTKPIAKDGVQGDVVIPEPKAPERGPAPAEAAKPGISGVKVAGLFRENPTQQKVVFDFLDSLKEKSVFFNVKDKDPRDLGVRTDSPAGDRWAWAFEMDLPLKENIEVK